MPFKFNPLTGKLDLVGSSSANVSDNYIVEHKTITLAQANAKEIVLSNTPTDSTKVVLDIISGTPQENGFDFGVVGNVLTWDGFALETVMEENDKIRIIYTL